MGVTVSILKMKSLTNHYGNSNILYDASLDPTVYLQDSAGITPYRATYNIVYDGNGTVESDTVYFDLDTGLISISDMIFGYAPTNAQIGKYCLCGLYPNTTKSVSFSWGFVETAGTGGRQIWVTNPSTKFHVYPQSFQHKSLKGARISHDSRLDAGNVYPLIVAPSANGCRGSIIFRVEFREIEKIDGV